MPRVVGCDPGTSSLDLLLLADGAVKDQARIDPTAFASPRASGEALIAQLAQWSPLDLIAGPSGYGLPLVSRTDVTPELRDWMIGVRPDAVRNEGAGEVTGLRGWLDALLDSDYPVIFLPGGYQLPTIPRYRKANTLDLGTADKVCVAALALENARRELGRSYETFHAAVVEIGSAFTAILVLRGGVIVDAAAGTKGPLGLRSSGAWDGEVAYALSPLRKRDLFRGGALDLGPLGPPLLIESVVKHVAGLQAVTPFNVIILSGAGCAHPWVRLPLAKALQPLGHVRFLDPLPGAWVKHAAQGAALLADGLAGGTCQPLVDHLQLRLAHTPTDLLRIRPQDSHDHDSPATEHRTEPRSGNLS